MIIRTIYLLILKRVLIAATMKTLQDDERLWLIHGAQELQKQAQAKTTVQASTPNLAVVFRLLAKLPSHPTVYLANP